MPGTACVTMCQSMLPNMQWFYLWQCPCTWIHFMHGLVMWICLEKSTDTSQKPGSHLLAIAAPPHPVFGALWTTTGAELKRSRTSGAGFGAGGAGAGTLVAVGLLPAPCPRFTQHPSSR